MKQTVIPACLCKTSIIISERLTTACTHYSEQQDKKKTAESK